MSIYYLIKQGKFPEPDIILNSRLKYYSREKLVIALREVFKFDLDKYEEDNITDNE